MTSPRTSKDLLRTWREQGVPVEETSPEERARHVAAIRRSLGEVTPRRQRSHKWRIAGALALAAAVVLSVGTIWHGQHAGSEGPIAQSAQSESGEAIGQARVTASIEGDLQQVSVVRASAAERLDPTLLSTGDRIRIASADGVLVHLPSGARGTLAAESSLKLKSLSPERLQLDAGRIEVRVPKLPKGDTFVVDTFDTRVLVIGTRFAVEVVEKPVRATTVSVTEGRVWVEHGGQRVVLGVGDFWISNNASEAQPSAEAKQRTEFGAVNADEAGPSSKTPTKENARAALGTTEPTPAEPVPGASASSLEAQNRLFADAVAARNSGNLGLALSRFDELLREHPNGPLAHEVRVQRLRLLDRLGRTAEAAREARTYLRLYPNGPASDEARKLALPH